MDSNELRENFLSFFKQIDHTVVPSSKLLPESDNSIMFANAGMNQFRDVFLGFGERSYSKAASCQKCLRSGGKHNDLENVGKTYRHLTFFEMLGNFSFGEYFRDEAIEFAWLVSRQVFNFDESKIHVSVLKGDTETKNTWKKFIPENRIVELGESDNFWSMGPTGPCGACTELYYDRGENFGKYNSVSEDTEGDRFIEYWNLVLMGQNRDSSGELKPLPRKCIDTGAGLERLLMIVNDKESVFETETLKSLIDHLFLISKKDPSDPVAITACRVIADHFRSICFAIADGGIPSNVDRGYVIRKIIRRACISSKNIGIESPFLHTLLPILQHHMGATYPELISQADRITEIISTEELSFSHNISKHWNILEKNFNEAKQNHSVLDPKTVFKLKDTYGLPLEEILSAADNEGLYIDQTKLKEIFQSSKQNISTPKTNNNQIQSDFKTEFLGYNAYQCQGKILDIITESSNETNQIIVITDQTVMFAESGGQSGDTGTIQTDNGTFVVTSTVCVNKSILHKGYISNGKLQTGETATITIDVDKRKNTSKNHSATHLLHWALCEVLGDHIRQAGSLVDNEKLRFDFTHHKPLSKDDITHIESLVCSAIMYNKGITTSVVTYNSVISDSSIKKFFTDKYDTYVRVVETPISPCKVHKELCGGTHVSMSGDIGLFYIQKSSGIASGIQRIEAVTGLNALKFCRNSISILDDICTQFKTTHNKLKQHLSNIVSNKNMLEIELKTTKHKLYSSICTHLAQTNNNNIFIHECSFCMQSELRDVCLIFSEKCQQAKIVVVFQINEDTTTLVIHSKSIDLRSIALPKEFKGGGSAHIIQGTITSGLTELIIKEIKNTQCQ